MRVILAFLIITKDLKMFEQSMADTIVNSLVEGHRQCLVAKGLEIQDNWVDVQKLVWHNALKAGQCTLQELQAMVFKKS